MFVEHVPLPFIRVWAGQSHQTTAADGETGKRSARLKAAIVTSAQSAFFPRGLVAKTTGEIGTENVHDDPHTVLGHFSTGCCNGFLLAQERNSAKALVLGLLNVTPAHDGLPRWWGETRGRACAWQQERQRRRRLLRAEWRRLLQQQRPQRRRRSQDLSVGACLSCVFCAVPPVRRGPEPELRAKLSRFRRC